MTSLSSSFLLSIFLLFQVFLLCIFTHYFVFIKPVTQLSFLLAFSVIVFTNILLNFIILRKLIGAEYQVLLAKEQVKNQENMKALIHDIRTQRHDFINHLQTVYGLLQMNKAENAQSYLAEVVKEVRISTHLVNLKQPEVGALLQRKINQAMAQDISFSLTVQSDLLVIPVRAYQLNRILGNLIDNAFESVMGLERKERFVKVEINEDEKNYIFKVLDSGPGLKPEILAYIFKPGFSTKGPDRGLGLSIARDIVEQHGGTISLSSPPTIFTIKLPKRRERQ